MAFHILSFFLLPVLVFGQYNDLDYPTVLRESEWTHDSLKPYGRIAGLDASNSQELYIFGRVDREWRHDSFKNDIFVDKEKGPITVDTIGVIDQSTGILTKSFGSGLFYMPHGITVAPSGDVWVTDVALHQVFRFSQNDLSKPNLIIGEAFVPGNDVKHFCKPADIAISSSGVAFVSDGYCNSRVLIIDPAGVVMREVATGEFDIPHSITLLEEQDMFCVADRENRRVACYGAGLRQQNLGVKMAQLTHPSSGRIYAVDHSGDVILALNGPAIEGLLDPSVAAMDLESGRTLSYLTPSTRLLLPHDVSISGDGMRVFVADLDPKAAQNVYRFDF